MRQKTHFATGLRCTDCQQQLSLDNLHYTCGCGANLQVEYDYSQIQQHLTQRSLAANTDHTMWRYAALYPVSSKIEVPPIGMTPLFQAQRLAQQLELGELWIKDDGRNPSASFKDRATAIALCHARELGQQLVVGASTGNAASSTAVLAAALGMRARIFIPKAAPKAKVAQLLAFGAEVFAVDGSYDQAFDLCLRACKHFSWYNRNTGYNPYTREGKKSAAFEICEQLQWQVPDLVVVPVGDGNIISGIWKGFVEFRRLQLIDRLPRLLAVQAEGSAAIVNAIAGDGSIVEVSGQTLADSISVSLPRDGRAAVQAVRDSSGLAMAVSDDEILQAILQLARGAGVFAEPAAAAAYAGLKKAVELGQIERGTRAVVVVTGNGLKDVSAPLRVTDTPQLIAPNPEDLESIFPQG